MAKEIIHTDTAPKAFAGYSQAVKSNGLIFVSGQGPMHPTTGEVVGDSIQEQTAQCLRNLSAILTAAGSSLAAAVSATVLLAEEADFAGMNEVWGKSFAVDPPARQVTRLGARPKGMKISIAVIAEA